MSIALVAGANSMIGKSICKTLSDNNYLVLEHGYRSKKPYQADLTNEAGATFLFHKIDSINVFISCVGGNRGPTGKLLNDNCTAMSKTEIDWLFATNFTANVLAAQEALKHLEPGGKIIFIGSDTVNNPRPNGQVGIYAAAKAALHEYTIHLANEMKGHISVNCVAPASVQSPQLPSEKVAEAVWQLCQQDITGQIIRLPAETATARFLL